MRYGKVCILADADSDGAHIATLLCALFVRHFRALVEAGRVCVAMPPLFRVDVGKHVFYALDEKEQQNILDHIKKEKLRGTVNVQRFKGLGEMNPEELWETTLTPDNRTVLRVQYSKGTKDKSKDDQKMIKVLMGDEVAPRKDFITNNALDVTNLDI